MPSLAHINKGRQGEDGARSHRLTSRTDGLDHVIFQDGVTPQDLADDAHGNNCRGDGRRNGHAYTQSQVGVSAAEDDGRWRSIRTGTGV